MVSSTYSGQSVRSFRISILSASLSPHKASRRHCGGRHGGRHGSNSRLRTRVQKRMEKCSARVQSGKTAACRKIGRRGFCPRRLCPRVSRHRKIGQLQSGQLVRRRVARGRRGQMAMLKPRQWTGNSLPLCMRVNYVYYRSGST